MKRMRAMGLTLLLAGCGPMPFKTNEPLQTVKPSPFGPVQTVKGPKRELSPASKEESLRVDIVGQKLIEANRQVGIRPTFMTIGAPTPEVFHRSTASVVITEGLSKQCRNEAQLAAVLAYEMGRMVAERESLASPAARQPERLPPMESRVGTDSGGVFGSPDGTRMAELAKFEKERPRPKTAPPPPPDPLVLAKGYLEKAGFTGKDLDDVVPLLKQARTHNDFERQLKGGAAVRPWTE